MDYYELYHQQQQMVSLKRIVNDMNSNNSIDVNKNNEIMVYFEKTPHGYVGREFKELGFEFMDNGAGEGGWFTKNLYTRKFTCSTIANYLRVLFLVAFVLVGLSWAVYYETGFLLIGCFVKERFGCRTFTL